MAVKLRILTGTKEFSLTEEPASTINYVSFDNHNVTILTHSKKFTHIMSLTSIIREHKSFIQVKQKLCRLLNTEFSLIELRLGEQQLQNDQAHYLLIFGQFRAISFRSLASSMVNKKVVLTSSFQLWSLLRSWKQPSRCPHSSLRKKKRTRRRRMKMRKSPLMLSLLDNHTTLGQDSFTSRKKIFLKRTNERAPWEGLKSE